MRAGFIFLVLFYLTQAVAAGVYYLQDQNGNVRRFSGDTPYPAGAIVESDVSVDMDERFLTVTNGVVVAKSVEEIEQIKVADEVEMQAAKSVELKALENEFYELCNQLFGDYGKRGFVEIRAKVEQLQATDPMLAVTMSLRLLAIDAEARREGGDKWWDTAIRHGVQ